MLPRCASLLARIDASFVVANRALIHSDNCVRQPTGLNGALFYRASSVTLQIKTNRALFHRAAPVRTKTIAAEVTDSWRAEDMESVTDLHSIDVVDKVEPTGEPDRPEYPWKRSKKVAAMLSFSGKNYYGMQRNPGPEINTIEDELMSALSKSGAIDPDWELHPQKAFFTRASRTDKGVSAARMTVSLKMLPDVALVPVINSHLPPDIRLQGLVRATKNFNCQSAADARTYLYLLPTFAFSPCDEVVTEAWRCKPDTIDRMNAVLKHYVGSHYFHNYTSSKLPMEPSSRRFMQEFEAGPVFEQDGLEWSVVRVRGQSFMLHQIRKMIGLAIAVVRGHTGLETIEAAWGKERIDIPRAPGLGLLLDAIHYDRYNKRYGDDGEHDKLDWAAQEEAVEKFKQEMIFSDIMRTEVEEKSLLLWMGQVLPMHTFAPRHFESEDSEAQPLAAAKRLLGKKEGEVTDVEAEEENGS